MGTARDILFYLCELPLLIVQWVFRKHSASGGMLGSAREGKKTHSLALPIQIEKSREDFLKLKSPYFFSI